MLGAIESGLEEGKERARRANRAKKRGKVTNLFGPRAPADRVLPPQAPLSDEELVLLREIIAEYTDNYGSYVMKQGARNESLASEFRKNWEADL
jgi:hypothetical protein